MVDPAGLASTILIDVGPATGPHGERGIGRYVRSLVDCIDAMPDIDREQIWAFAQASPTIETFGHRGIAAATRPFPLGPGGLVGGRIASGRAVRSSGARVLHATDPQRPWSPGRCRTVVTVYDLIPLHEPEMLRSWRADHRFTYRWYLRQLRQADRLVAISKTTAEDVADRLDVPPERIDVVYPAVRVPIFTARSPADRPTFLFVGAQDPHKQADLALEAFARFRARTGDGMMRFIGPASDAQARALRRMAIDLGVGESVQIEGRVSDAELDRAYLQATALLWTSRLEGFGLPPIEAIFRGLPVIAVDTTAARETLGDAARFVPSEVEAVVAAMEVPLVPNATTVAALRDRYSVAAASQALRASYAKAGR